MWDGDQAKKTETYQTNMMKGKYDYTIPSVGTLESHHALRGMKKLWSSLFSRLVKGQKIIQYLRLKNIDDPSGMIQRISAMIFNNLIGLGPLKWSQQRSQPLPRTPSARRSGAPGARPDSSWELAVIPQAVQAEEVRICVLRG